MALIEKEPQIPKKEQLNVRLDPDVSDMLRQYCVFLDSGVHYVVGEVLRYTFRKDKEFQAWLTSVQTEPQEKAAKDSLEDE